MGRPGCLDVPLIAAVPKARLRLASAFYPPVVGEPGRSRPASAVAGVPQTTTEHVPAAAGKPRDGHGVGGGLRDNDRGSKTKTNGFALARRAFPQESGSGRHFATAPSAAAITSKRYGNTVQIVPLKHVAALVKRAVETTATRECAHVRKVVLASIVTRRLRHGEPAS